MICTVDATAPSGRTSGFNGVIMTSRPLASVLHILRDHHSAHAEPRAHPTAGPPMSSALFHAIYASVVFVVCYVLITTERFNKTKVALAGAILMFFLPLINSDEVFYSRDTGVNWDVLFLLLGMMIIVSVVRQTGAFEYVAIWSAKRAKGSPLRIMILLILVTALGTAVLDNVTTVLLIAPVTLLVCDRLAVNPAPFLGHRSDRRQHRRCGDPGR